MPIGNNRREGGATWISGLLSDLADEAQAAHSRGESIRQLNIELHRQIIRVSRNPVRGAVSETAPLVLLDRLKPLLRNAASDVTVGLHKKLLDAFRRRDSAAARRIMEDDIASVGGRFALLDARNQPPRKKE